MLLFGRFHGCANAADSWITRVWSGETRAKSITCEPRKEQDVYLSGLGFVRIPPEFSIRIPFLAQLVERQ